MESKGPFLLIKDAIKMADITRNTLMKYVNAGYLELHYNGQMVYYRELLEASWIAKKNQMKNSAGYVRNGIKYK